MNDNYKVVTLTEDINPVSCLRFLFSDYYIKKGCQFEFETVTSDGGVVNISEDGMLTIDSSEGWHSLRIRIRKYANTIWGQTKIITVKDFSKYQLDESLTF